jgi:hypothetical protein
MFRCKEDLNPNYSRGISPPSLGICYDFANLITKCDFKEFRSRIKHSKVHKTHQGEFITGRNILFFYVLIPGLRFILFSWLWRCVWLVVHYSSISCLAVSPHYGNIIFLMWPLCLIWQYFSLPINNFSSLPDCDNVWLVVLSHLPSGCVFIKWRPTSMDILIFWRHLCPHKTGFPPTCSDVKRTWILTNVLIKTNFYLPFLYTKLMKK